MKSPVKKFLLKLLKVTAQEAAQLAVEEVKRKWPALSVLQTLMIDGHMYEIAELQDNGTVVVGHRYNEGGNGKPVVIKANESDLKWDNNIQAWRLDGR